MVFYADDVRSMVDVLGANDDEYVSKSAWYPERERKKDARRALGATAAGASVGGAGLAGGIFESTYRRNAEGQRRNLEREFRNDPSKFAPRGYGDKFTSRQQESRVKRMRDLYNHPGTGPHEKKVAGEKLKSEGFSTSKPTYDKFDPKKWGGVRRRWHMLSQGGGFRGGRKDVLASLGRAAFVGAVPGAYVGAGVGLQGVHNNQQRLKREHRARLAAQRRRTAAQQASTA